MVQSLLFTFASLIFALSIIHSKLIFMLPKSPAPAPGTIAYTPVRFGKEWQVLKTKAYIKDGKVLYKIRTAATFNNEKAARMYAKVAPVAPLLLYILAWGAVLGTCIYFTASDTIFDLATRLR